ncbi:MAG: DNA repair protein RecO [Gemmatimonadaceae bacterium]|nr:DNA repair protein RecO [Gemmatimonadaceae bacterium]
MPAQVTDAIVLHAFDYLETSRILRLVTRESGVQSVLARGARRSVRRFGAALDLFVSGTAELQVRQGRDLQQLTAFDVTNARSALSLDLDRFTSASMLCELALRCSAGDDQGGLFEALSDALDVVARSEGSGAREAGLGAAWRVTAALGFAPAVDQCARCHQAIDPEAAALFSHAVGGAACATCATQVRLGRQLPGDARRALRQWLVGGEVALGSDASRRAHVRLLREFVMHHVAEGAELRAFRAWEARFA